MEKAEGPLVVGERIRELTKAKGWTQQELAWQAMMGHASPQMTLRVYSHVQAETCRPFLESLGGREEPAARVAVEDHLALTAGTDRT